MTSDRFDRFLPLAGALAGLLFFVALLLLWNDPASETGPAETFAFWQDNRGQHQIVALLVAPLIAFLLLFFGSDCAGASPKETLTLVMAWSPSPERCWVL